MRRLATILGLVGLLAGALVAQGASDGPSSTGQEFFAELDNAFGLIEGGDLKIAGVRAGKVTSLELNKATKRAVVGFEVTQEGFGDLRSDVTCASRPQSLIGEYFIDCQPGVSKKRLEPESVIPVQRTRSTVAPDLVNTILRRPYRERLSIIIGELGAAVGGNEEELNDAIRRASPALEETDKVLAILAKQNTTLARLAKNADTVVGDLDENRKNVARWVVEAGETATVSAARRAEIAAGFKRLPAFLEELEPTMKALGETADAQTPALRDLRASSGQLTQFLDRLGPFADASRPATRALGSAAKKGSAAVKALAPVARELRPFARQTPELGRNLAITLEHLDDPKWAVEEDPRAARSTGRAAPTGYTGLEALLQYVFDQATSTNVFDANSHALKVGLIAGGNCAAYADEKRAKEVGDECAAALGPNQPGLNFPDPSAFEEGKAATRDARKGPKVPSAAGAQPAPAPGAAAPGADAPSEAAKPSTTKPPLGLGPIEIPPVLPDMPGMPSIPGVTGKDANPLDGLTRRSGTSALAQNALLDYFLGS